MPTVYILVLPRRVTIVDPPGKQNLKHRLITVCEEYIYAVSHEMIFNHKKSVILICRSKYMNNVYTVFSLNGKIIDESDTVRYLGHIICNSGKYDKDIMRQCQQMYARGNALFRKFHMCSMSVKIQLFKGALYRIQILCRRYTFWSYPAGLTIADPPG